MTQTSQEALRAIWTQGEEYQTGFTHKKDEVLDSVLKKSSDEGLPDIAVSQSQGKFLHLLARTIGARNVLEVGTLGGSGVFQFEI
jgi:predicted O-methyltransferase YrrM